MPKIFSKNMKLNVIEYGQQGPQSTSLKPLAAALIHNLKKLLRAS